MKDMLFLAKQCNLQADAADDSLGHVSISTQDKMKKG
jgi:hypothetical protein